MMLGQPTTDAERAAEEAALVARQAARERRDAQAVALYRKLRDRGIDAAPASARAARAFRIGRGGAQHVRNCAERAYLAERA